MNKPQKLNVDAVREWITSTLSKNDLIRPDGRWLSYTPQARKDFISAVTARANLLGLSEKTCVLNMTPAHAQVDVTVIAGQD